MGRDNHSKYEKLYEKSVKVALTNKSRQIGKSKIYANDQHTERNEHTERNDNESVMHDGKHIKVKSKSNRQKRKLSEYNKFISENSSKVTGPDRLKKLSKLWKQYKTNNKINKTNDIENDSYKLKQRQSSKLSTTVNKPASTEHKRSKTVSTRKSKQPVDFIQTKPPKPPKSPKQTKPPKQTKSTKPPKPTKPEKSTKPPKSEKSTKPPKSPKSTKQTKIPKSPKIVKSRQNKSKKIYKDSESKGKDTIAKSPGKYKKLRFFNYVGSPKSNENIR